MPEHPGGKVRQRILYVYGQLSRLDFPVSNPRLEYLIFPPNMWRCTTSEFIPLSFWYDVPLTARDRDRRPHPWPVDGALPCRLALPRAWLGPAGRSRRRRPRRTAGIPPGAPAGPARRLVRPPEPPHQTACESGKHKAPPSPRAGGAMPGSGSSASGTPLAAAPRRSPGRPRRRSPGRRGAGAGVPGVQAPCGGAPEAAHAPAGRGADAGAPAGAPGAPPASAAPRAGHEPGQARRPRARPPPSVAAGGPRSREGERLCAAHLLGAPHALATKGLIGINSNVLMSKPRTPGMR